MGMKQEKQYRQDIINAGMRMNELGINQGTSGNISLRWKDGILVTPTGVPYEELKPEDICWQHLDGNVKGKLEISSEWRFHIEIQRHRPDVNAVVHTHSNHATALAIQEMEIPAIHYMVAAGGGPNIRCAPYATFGTQELAENALTALKNRSCCLLAHHGVIATGSSLSTALWLASEVETIAKQYILILSTGQKPKLLSDAEIERVRTKMSGYGLKNRKGKLVG
jgi:L-fuculose-phosphate aldolase